MTEQDNSGFSAANSPDNLGQWPSLRESFFVWLRVALLSFGGPAGQIAVMHRIVVEEKRWIDDSRFLQSMNFCMLLPGPEAQQLATYIGWLLHGVRGGLIAGILFVLPGLITIMVLSWIYVLYGEVGLVHWLFFGLKCAVLSIVMFALVRISRRILSHRLLLAIAAFAFIAIFVFGIPFPIIILTAALLGWIGASLSHPAFKPTAHGAHSQQSRLESALITDQLPSHTAVSGQQTLKLIATIGALWLAPTMLLLLTLGSESVFSQIAVFFSKMAVVTFGGAYAVLAYVGQAAVENYGWLQPAEMLDGLGMAETTPGPLIMVTQFVGFIGAFRETGALPALSLPLPPLLAATLGGLLTTWVTFVPCFLWIFAGAPFIEKLRQSVQLSGALTAITAAVVGVMLNLGAWFAMHLLFSRIHSHTLAGLTLNLPDFTSLNFFALALTILMLLLAFKMKLNSVWLIAIAALLGVFSGFIGLLG